MRKEIAVVIPTIRPDDYANFLKAWMPLFKEHSVILITVIDGEIPRVAQFEGELGKTGEEVMGKYAGCL